MMPPAVPPSVLEKLPSPALVLDWRRIEENLASMIRLAGGPERLRPHVKTHKMRRLTERQLALGIRKFKAATLAEVEMCADAGARDVLLAMQPVGPNAALLAALAKRRPETRFSALIDDPGALRALAAAARAEGVTIPVFLDLNLGQNRTGIAPGPEAAALYREMAETPGVVPAGLHGYDGHLTQSDLPLRAAGCDAGFTPVEALRRELLDAGLPVPVIVAGGSPVFPVHARRGPEVELSPGTTVLWDAGYGQKFPDLPFKPAAWLLTRVVSRPAPGLICVDLGHKAVGSEMPHPRAVFPELPDAEAVTHSEEHLVLRVASADALPPGRALWAVPRHVCPTVALHSFVWILEESGALTGPRAVDARGRDVSVAG